MFQIGPTLPNLIQNSLLSQSVGTPITKIELAKLRLSNYVRGINFENIIDLIKINKIMWKITLFSLEAFAVNLERSPVMCFVACPPGTHQANPYTCDCEPDVALAEIYLMPKP